MNEVQTRRMQARILKTRQGTLGFWNQHSNKLHVTTDWDGRGPWRHSTRRMGSLVDGVCWFLYHQTLQVARRHLEHPRHSLECKEKILVSNCSVDFALFIHPPSHAKFSHFSFMQFKLIPFHQYK